MPPNWTGFTTVGQGGLLSVLKNQCGVSQAFAPTLVPDQPPAAAPEVKQFDAIWDTGATNSVITQSVVDALGLVSTSMAKVHGVGGEEIAEVYLVNIRLPNNVTFANLHVTKGKLIGADMLIGMDIIGQGDFAVTNYGGITKFSFRLPSQKHIDFVEQFNEILMRERYQHGGKGKDRLKRHKTFGKNKKKI